MKTIIMKKASTVFLICIISLYSHGQFVLQNSNHSSSVGWGFYFTDSLTGYCAANSGTILKTTNGCGSWIPISLGATNGMRDVHFVNDDTGYVVGTLGSMYKTYDAGNSWTYIPTGTTATLLDVQFINANIGFIVGGSSSAGKHIWRTLNGGSTWDTVATLNHYPYGLFFVNEYIGYCVGQGGMCVKTTNSGATWTNSYPTGVSTSYMWSVYFTNELTGYVVGQSGTIIKTTDGGGSWTALTSGTSKYLKSVFFTSDSVGYVVGSKTSGVSTTILKTTDAGNTWNLLPAPFIESLNGVYFVNENTGFVGGSFGTLYKIDNTITYNDTTLPQTPVVSLGNDTNVCAGFSLDAGPGYSGYLWQDNSTGQFYNITDTDTCWVKVMSSGCWSVPDTIIVTFDTIPVVNLGPDDTLCSGTTLDAGPGFLTYQWSNGPYTRYTTVSTSGDYIVTVTNSCGFAIDTVHITAKQTPVVNLGPDTLVCQGNLLVLDAGNPGSSYEWSISGQTNQLLVVITTGTYWVKVTKNGCIDFDSITVGFVPKPAVNLGADDTICSAETKVLNAGNPGCSYQWSVSGQTGQQLTVNTSGTYWVKVTNSSGCFEYDTVNILVLQAPSVNLGSDTIICQGDSIMLDAGNSGATYYWTGGQTGQQITIGASGSYWVKVTGSNMCSSYDTIQITVEPLPLVNLGADTIICQGDSIILNAGNPGAGYLWSTNQITQQIPIMAQGTYWVDVISQNGCIGRDTVDVAVQQYPLVNLGPDTTICQGNVVAFDAGNPGAIFLWSNGHTGQQFSTDTAGTFWVIVSVNNCESFDTVSVMVQAMPSAVISVSHDTVMINSSMTFSASTSATSVTWDFGTGATPLTASGNGPHTVSYASDGLKTISTTVTEYPCDTTYTTEVFVFDDSGIPGNDLSEIEIYPNPTNGKFYISNLPEAWRKINIIIYNAEGKLILYKEYILVNSPEIEIELQNRSKGFYNVEIRSEKEFVKRVLVFE